MKKITFETMMLFTFLLLSTAAMSQYVVKPTFFETNGVSNQGIVSGYESQAGPYSLWNPADNSFQVIGGLAPGNGIGGRAHFSGDGNRISGSSLTTLPVSTAWERRILADYNYIFKAMEFPAAGDGLFGYAVGQSLTYNGDGIVLRTTNGGASWGAMWVDTENRGLEAMSFPSPYIGYVGGWNQYFAKTQNTGWDWEILDPAGDDDVYIYTAIEFKDELNGVVAAQLNDGLGVYITSDGGLSWTKGSGLLAVASKIKYTGNNTYFLTTNGGHVQKSTDNGLSWTNVYAIPGALFLGLNFFDEQTGYVLGETYIHKTTDGGNTWTELAVSPGLTDGVLWRDIQWIDAQNLVITGTPDVVFESGNGGQSWTWANQAIFNGDPALYEIAVTPTSVQICGSQGNFYFKSRLSSIDVAEMSVYDVSSEQWTPLGSLGIIVDNTTSAGYSISGDGLTVVGNSWADPANGNGTTSYAHAFAWNQAEGLIDLGSMYAYLNRSARAEAVSADGNVVVGYQDFNGPWKSAVWRKNPAGGYFPNEYLLVDPDGNPNNEFNQLGMASAVSADGNWIGGYGDYAFPNAWLWSQNTGVVDLGNLGLPEGTTGNVAGMSADGSIVVGWYVYAPDPWTQNYTPFIWTAAMGAMDLNTFITDYLGYTMEIGPIWSANTISPNGKFIAGWGLDPTIGSWGELFTFRLELPDGWVKTTENELSVHVSVYPNPVCDKLTIQAGEKIEKVELFDANGLLVTKEIANQSKFTMNTEKLASGIYFAKVTTKELSKTVKIVKN